MHFQETEHYGVKQTYTGFLDAKDSIVSRTMHLWALASGNILNHHVQ